MSYTGFVTADVEECINLKRPSSPIFVKVCFSVKHAKTEEQMKEEFANQKGSLWGQMCKCGELISWASGGLWSSEQLNKKEYHGPSRFTINVWDDSDYRKSYNLKSVFDMTFTDVKWLSVAHSSVSGENECCGLADFTYDKMILNENYIPMKCDIPRSVHYPSWHIGELMIKHARPQEDDYEI